MAQNSKRVRNVRPDALDFRDLPFRANVAVAPQPRLFPSLRLPVKDQGETNACTGFGLSLVVEHLLRRARRPAATVSPYMLYSMARRYDEFPGAKDEGSSLRGALKGWFKHGACVDSLWRSGVAMPPVPDDPKKDWWLEAVNRPLGAYYRIATRSIADIHCALNEVGIVCASAVVPGGLGRRRAPEAAGGAAALVPQPDLGHPAAQGHARRRRARLRLRRLRRARLPAAELVGRRLGHARLRDPRLR